MRTPPPPLRSKKEKEGKKKKMCNLTKDKDFIGLKSVGLIKGGFHVKSLYFLFGFRANFLLRRLFDMSRNYN